MLPLSSRHQQESEVIPKKPPASADLHPEPLLDSDEAAAIMRIHPEDSPEVCKARNRKGSAARVHVAISRK